MSSLAERIANAFGGAKRSGSGYMCKCPCHDDKTASLGVVDHEDSVTVNCLAGCDWKDIKQIAIDRGLLPTFNAKPAMATRAVYNSNGAITYRYLDKDGVEVCQKVRYPGKRFAIQRYQAGVLIKNIQGVEVPLYNFPNLLKPENDTVYLCEGEKDCDNLNRLGLCATTNIAGASHWRDEYNQYFKDKVVIICQDNDEAGRGRTSKITGALRGIAKQLWLFDPPAMLEHGDVTDWLNAGGDANDILTIARAGKSETLITSSSPTTTTTSVTTTAPLPEPSPRKVTKKRRDAIQADYFELIEKSLLKPRRCIFSEKLMTYETHNHLWNPAINHLEILKSEAYLLSETTNVKYNVAQIQPHFFKYESLQKPMLLVAIPEWDGIDRIRELAQAVQLKEEAGVSNTSFEELLKEWCCRVFARLNDPMFQNRMLILQSNKQGVGKDTWINMLCGGLGQFLVPLSCLKEDKDTYINLSRGLVCSISEFDKTSRTESSVLKDLITSASTNLRGPYERDAKVRANRCSFISSANVENLLRDSTGSRRFLVFQLTAISYFYRTWTREQIRTYQMQCIAQMRELFKAHYIAGQEAWQEMNEYLEKETPEDPGTMLVEQFLAEIKRDLRFNAKKDLAMTDEILIETVKKIIERTRLSYNGAITLLKNKIGVYRRIGSSRFWVLRIPQVEYNADEQE